MELGLITLTELTPDPVTGAVISPRQRLKEIVDAAVLAEQAGLDVVAVGEHHRADYAVSSPAVVLAAIAQATERIRLTSGTTLLSTADPVRVYQDFATVDLLSGGRTEIIAGRGAFTESFELFGYDLADYDALFAEHLDLLLRIARQERVTWRGRFRPPLDDAEVTPRAEQDPLPVWLGVGGNPQSAVRAGQLGLPMTLALIGGNPAALGPVVELYRRTAAAAGHDAARLPVATSSHLHVAPTSQGARDEFYPYYRHYLEYHSGGRFRVDRASFEQVGSPHGALYVGSPQEIVEKALWEREILGHQRIFAQVDLGGLPYDTVARTIELLATEVAPALRAAAPPTAASA
ncbi:LLM class flavin-dependent oxidoreductase [Pseudonocardia pini]|uniref:LLM class flavin-dependent oxidoreductase n=1 Tax=Pseudonocardia pini TaxID=2758030 RepID=UPI0015F0D0F9|nr:LLM class flavin-dependent oxidoreductase [Pseudonocardia pini]